MTYTIEGYSLGGSRPKYMQGIDEDDVILTAKIFSFLTEDKDRLNQAILDGFLDTSKETYLSMEIKEENKIIGREKQDIMKSINKYSREIIKEIHSLDYLKTRTPAQIRNEAKQIALSGKYEETPIMKQLLTEIDRYENLPRLKHVREDTNYKVTKKGFNFFETYRSFFENNMEPVYPMKSTKKEIENIPSAMQENIIEIPAAKQKRFKF